MGKTIAINGSIARRDSGAHTKVYGAAFGAAKLHGFWIHCANEVMASHRSILEAYGRCLGPRRICWRLVPHEATWLLCPLAAVGAQRIPRAPPLRSP